MQAGVMGDFRSDVFISMEGTGMEGRASIGFSDKNSVTILK